MNEQCVARMFTLALAFALGCEPLTYSREGALDFTRYRSAAVNVNGGNAEDTGYLVQELCDVSGFASVTSEPSEADVHITVATDVAIETWVDDDGDTHVDYEGSATYVATDRFGVPLFEDGITDSSYSYDETTEDLLDEVAHEFLAPYRL